MRQRLSSFLLWSVFFMVFIGCETKPLEPHERVNPFIGTGGHGHTYPGATSPFGMVQLSPDTRLTGWDGCGGYHYSDSIIYGFSHTHLQGTGVSDYGDILFAPCTRYKEGAENWSERYSSAFSHDHEFAEAGYYSVLLEDQGIEVELTTTPHVGIHRYRMTKPDTMTLVIDMQHRDQLLEYSIYPLNDTTLVGHRISNNWATEQHVYFAARFDQPFEWLDQFTEVNPPIKNDAGEWVQDVEFVPVFGCDFGIIEELNIEVALSFVSIQGALANLAEEAVHESFEGYRSAAEKEWNKHLSGIEVNGGSDRELEIFYTALYHCLTTPNIASDVTGEYRGTDLNIHQLEEDEGDHYTVFSLWDTFRALHPLLNWIEPEKSRDFMRSMLRMYTDGGQLPVWELSSNYTGCMIGYHSAPVIADAITWGIEDFDLTMALDGLIQAADSAHLGIPAYTELGYIPLEKEHESVSKTLEYAFDDACIARVAKHLSDQSNDKAYPFELDSIIQRFSKRALSYRNLFNPETGFFQPKRGAAWLERFDPKEVNFNYTEANGWQYNFFVPHDVNGHIQLLGGPSAYGDKLNSMFTSSSETTGRQQADITGLIGQYAHGNEPSHHMAYLFPYVGEAHRTAELVDQIRDELYTNLPDGLSGNEDCGQMSAWYVWSALGMYPVCPGSSELIFGTPQFESVKIRPQSSGGNAIGTETTILRKGNGIYPQQVRFESYADTLALMNSIQKIDLLRGGTLVVNCSTTPKSPSPNPSQLPVSRWDDRDFISVPIVNAPRTFKDSAQLELNLNEKDASAQILFRLNQDLNELQGFEPWRTYQTPINITNTTVIEAKALRSDGVSSPIVGQTVYQVNHGHRLLSISEYDAQYAAGGDQALIDGIHGEHQYQTGDWQGYWGKTVEGVIDLGNAKTITEVKIGALRDIRPWIFLPKSITFESSMNQLNWTTFGTITIEEVQEDPTPEKFVYSLRNEMVGQWIRFRIEPFGTLPDWHLGAGNPSWTFLDEIDIITQD
ncbi:MAG: GH92 family glycosyl hydrolase [Flavobacteriales bacterium]